MKENRCKKCGILMKYPGASNNTDTCNYSIIWLTDTLNLIINFQKWFDTIFFLVKKHWKNLSPKQILSSLIFLILEMS